MDKLRRVWPGNLEEKILQFLFVEFISIYICNLQYCVKFPPPQHLLAGKPRPYPAVRERSMAIDREISLSQKNRKARDKLHIRDKQKKQPSLKQIRFSR